MTVGTPSDRRTAVLRVPSAARGALLIVGAWTVYGLVHAAFWIATGDMKWAVWRWEILAALILAWTWALLTPLIFRLTGSASPSRVGWFWSLVAHGIALVSITLFMTWLRGVLILKFADNVVPYWPRVVYWVDVHLFTYLAVVLTGRALQSHRRYIDRGLRAHVLETQLARAQLHYLELQLQPHFLFNSLNAIQELAHEAPDAAERMLRRLYALLAVSLERSGRDKVSLQDELSALDPYFDIQRTRFEWLSVTVRADDVARSALVPHLILQPLVENAIRHGLAVRRGPGNIDVIAERRGERLLLQVCDNGVGLAPMAARSRPGIGLRNAGERLRQLYGSDYRFELREADGGGVLVEIDVPYQVAPAQDRAASWRELGRSRETMPEVTMDEIAQWRTGEFVASMDRPNESGMAATVVEALEEDALPPLSSDVPRASASGNVTTAHTPDVSVMPAPVVNMRTWITLVAIWLGAAALWSSQTHVFSMMVLREDYSGLASNVKLQVGGAMYWMAVSLAVLYLSRRFRLTRRRLVPHLVIHVTAALASSFAFLFVLRALNLTQYPILAQFSLNPLSGNFLVYFGLLSWSHSRDFAAWYRAREITAAELTSEIARSRFQALCVQVRPQFLLGTLDLLARLVHLDVPRADRLIARLADVMRMTLDMAREPSTTVAQELQLLAVTVEAHRLGIRPAVTLHVDADPAALTTPMPSRLLCTMVDDLLAAEPDGAATPLVITVRAERAPDATRIRLHGDAVWKSGRTDLHDWWRTKSAAEAAVTDAGSLVTVAFPDRSTAVLIVPDEISHEMTTVAA